jgi:cellulose biosynthesis protein BcsQ
VANPKGGVGKSSLTVLLAAFSGINQLKFRDMDPQQSTRLAYSAMFGEEVTSKRELDCELFADLEREVKKITTQNHRTILIDTPAGISVSDLLSVQLASLLLVPVSGSPVELKATHTFVTSLLSCDYAVPILIVPNRIAKKADLLNVISTFANTRCLMSAPIAFDRQIESLLDEQQFPGELDDLQDVAYPLIHSINKAVKMPVPTLSKLVQVG